MVICNRPVSAIKRLGNPKEQGLRRQMRDRWSRCCRFEQFCACPVCALLLNASFRSRTHIHRKLSRSRNSFEIATPDRKLPMKSGKLPVEQRSFARPPTPQSNEKRRGTPAVKVCGKAACHGYNVLGLSYAALFVHFARALRRTVKNASSPHHCLVDRAKLKATE